MDHEDTDQDSSNENQNPSIPSLRISKTSEVEVAPSREEWLAGLKAGDEVARQSFGGWGRYINADFLHVDRLTERYIVVGSAKYRKDDGYEAGNKYRGYRLTPPSLELKTAIADQSRNRELLSLVEKIKWRDVPNPTLEAVIALVNAPPASATSPTGEAVRP